MRKVWLLVNVYKNCVEKSVPFPLKQKPRGIHFLSSLRNLCFQKLLVSGTRMDWLISGSSQVHLILSNAGENPEGLGGRRPGFLAEGDLHLTVGSWASQPLSAWVFICEVRLQTQRRSPPPLSASGTSRYLIWEAWARPMSHVKVSLTLMGSMGLLFHLDLPHLSHYQPFCISALPFLSKWPLCGWGQIGHQGELSMFGFKVAPNSLVSQHLGDSWVE